jgi:hypothetical protein
MPRNYKKARGGHLYLRYEENNLLHTLDEIKRGKMSIRKSAEYYHVPRSTLLDKIYGIHTKQVGGQTVINHKEESKLVEGLLKYAEWGFPIPESGIFKF